MARVAGVSRGTVSRVLNGGYQVSAKARELVENAIAQSGYTANQHARSLATGRSGSIAFLLSEPQHSLFSDPTYALLLRGATQALADRDMPLVLLVAETDADKRKVTRYVGAGHVDGVLLISSHEADPLLTMLVDEKVPLVCSGVPLSYPEKVASVSVDEAGGARAMTTYLRERRYRRIAHVTGPLDTPGGRFRRDGFREAMGDDFDQDLVELGDFTRASGAAAFERLIARVLDVEAVFAANDLMATGVIFQAQRRGLRVPEDLAVSGFDDSGIADAHEPAITTMRQPWDRISESMIDMLLRVMGGDPGERITLQTELIVRATT